MGGTAVPHCAVLRPTHRLVHYPLIPPTPPSLSLSLSHTHAWQVDDESCGQCVYAPNDGNLTKPWDCLFVNVLCGGGASCLNKPCGRPAGLNHKGAVDFWRREKLSYATVGALYA